MSFCQESHSQREESPHAVVLGHVSRRLCSPTAGWECAETSSQGESQSRYEQGTLSLPGHVPELSSGLHGTALHWSGCRAAGFLSKPAVGKNSVCVVVPTVSTREERRGKGRPVLLFPHSIQKIRLNC